MYTRRQMLAAAGGSVAVKEVIAQTPGYKQTIETWRTEREKNLKAADGWLSLVALEWLREGVEETAVAPGVKFLLKGGEVTAARNGTAPAVMKSDDPGPPEVMNIGTRTYTVIHRGNRYGIRVRDPESKYRKEFKGLHWYPVNAAYKVQGKLIPHASPKKVTVTTVVDGLTQELMSPGVVEFKLRGITCRLEPADEDDQLYFIFRDTTAGKTTYPAGRYMYTPKAKDGFVELDFNKAYNPPCAFTPYATCPLPVPANRLKIAVEAGELDYHK